MNVGRRPRPRSRRVAVIVETRDGKATAGSLGLLATARALGGSAGAVVCGPDAAGVAAGLARYGSETTFVGDVAGIDPSLGQAQVDVLATLVRDHGVRTVLFENSVLAADVAAGLAVRMDAGVNWDLQDLAVRDGAPWSGHAMPSMTASPSRSAGSEMCS